MSIISPFLTPVSEQTPTCSETKALNHHNHNNCNHNNHLNINSVLDPVNLALLNATPAEHISKNGSLNLSSSHKPSLETSLPAVVCDSRARIPLTSGGEVFLHAYRNAVDNKEHIAFVFGKETKSQSLFAVREGETEEDRMVRGAYDGTLYPGRSSSSFGDDDIEVDGVDNKSGLEEEDMLVRIHSECFTGETAFSGRCDCGDQLKEAVFEMAERGRGVIIYLRQEGRGIGLAEKLKAYNLQDLGADTVTANLLLKHPADARSFGVATSMLLDLGCKKIKLMTNNPDKIKTVEGPNKEIEVTQRVAMVPASWEKKSGGYQTKEVYQYLKTKVERMGHMLPK